MYACHFPATRSVITISPFSTLAARVRLLSPDSRRSQRGSSSIVCIALFNGRAPYWAS